MSEEQTQTCSNCNVEKNINNFYFRRNIKIFTKQCNFCSSEKRKKFRNENKDKIKEYSQKYSRTTKKNSTNTIETVDRLMKL